MNMYCFQMNQTVSRDVNFVFEKSISVCVCVWGGIMLIRRERNLPFRDRTDGGLGFESNLK